MDIIIYKSSTVFNRAKGRTSNDDFNFRHLEEEERGSNRRSSCHGSDGQKGRISRITHILPVDKTGFPKMKIFS